MRIDNDIVLRAEEQDAIWSELDELGKQMPSLEKAKNNTDPPTPKDFAKWFERNNSVDLRSLLRDIEIVFIEAAMDRNRSNCGHYRYPTYIFQSATENSDAPPGVRRQIDAHARPTGRPRPAIRPHQV